MKIQESELREFLLSHDVGEITHVLNDLEMELEYNRNLDAQKVTGIVRCMAEAAISEQQNDITDLILGTIITAQTFQDVSSDCLTSIADHLACLHDVQLQAEPKVLARYIEVLGYTHDRRYVPVVEKMQSFKNPLVQQSAKEALLEMGAL